MVIRFRAPNKEKKKNDCTLNNHIAIKRTQHNKGRFCNNSEIDTLILKQLSVENKAKQSQLRR